MGLVNILLKYTSYKMILYHMKVVNFNEIFIVCYKPLFHCTLFGKGKR